MIQFLRILLTLSLIWSAGAPASATTAAPPLKTVEAEGRGATEKEAEKQALQAAIEQAVGVDVQSTTRVNEGVVTSDKIRTHAEAFVQGFECLSKDKAPDGSFVVRLRVTLNLGNPSSVVDNNEVVRKLTDGLGKITFLVIDKHSAAADQGDSEVTVAAIGAVHSFLTQRGVDVVDQEQVERLKQDDTMLSESAETLAQRIAKSLHANIYVIVSGHVERTASVEVKFYESSTGRVLGESSGRSSAADSALADKKLAVCNAVKAAAAEAFATTMQYWKRNLAQGKQVTVVAYGLDFKRRSKFRKVLQHVLDSEDDVKQLSASAGYAEYNVWLKDDVTNFVENVVENAEKAGLKVVTNGDGPNQRLDRVVFRFE